MCYFLSLLDTWKLGYLCYYQIIPVMNFLIYNFREGLKKNGQTWEKFPTPPPGTWEPLTDFLNMLKILKNA